MTESKWVSDIGNMHKEFSVNEKVAQLSPEGLRSFLEFRVKFLKEEFTETMNAAYDRDAEEVVDGLIDLCVVAIGTLNALGIDEDKAWDAVQNANMAKEVGIKPSRPNPLGLPDLIKPVGWVGPNHTGNHGLLTKAFAEEE